MNKLLFALLLFASPVLAQRQIRIVDNRTGAPVQYVNVAFDGTGRYSNENGTVIIPYNVDVIELSHISYESKSDTIRLIVDNTIRLEPKIQPCLLL